jgi:FlaA1/EpsC-like NDP-sugar epimerase
MKIDEAVNLIFKATKLTKGGEIFILKMPAIRLGDLVDVFMEKYPNKERVIIGPRCGEKTHEELLTEYESTIAYDKEDLIVVPYFDDGGNKINKLYSSDTVYRLNKDEIRKLINGSN